MVRKDLEDLIHDKSKERMKSAAEVRARYVKALEKYRALIKGSGNTMEQKLALFNEIKTLGWVLGKRDKDISAELSE